MKEHDRLRQARINAGFKSAAEFADHFDLPEGTYRSHENGVRGMTRHVIKRYADLLHVSVDWLLTGEEQYISPGNYSPPTSREIDKELLKECVHLLKAEAKHQRKKISDEALIEMAVSLYEIAAEDRKAGIEKISPGSVKNIIKGL